MKTFKQRAHTLRRQGTREMLRLDHLQKQRQVKGGSGYSPVGTARSLEVLLAQHSAVAIAGNNHHHEQGDHLQQGADGGAATTTVAGEVARSSVSSSWSPPHLNTPMSNRQRRSSISSGIGTRLGIVSGSGSGGGGSGGSGGGRGGGGEEGGVSDGCQISAGGGRRDEERRIEMAPASPWRSDPPTPRMPCLGSGEPSTPNGRDFGARDVERYVPPCRALRSACWVFVIVVAFLCLLFSCIVFVKRRYFSCFFLHSLPLI